MKTTDIQDYAVAFAQAGRSAHACAAAVHDLHDIFGTISQQWLPQWYAAQLRRYAAWLTVPLPGSICEQCLDAPAVHIVPAP